MIRKPVIITAVVTALTGGLFLGSRNAVRSTSAYFTDREFHTNVYTFGDVTVDGTETDWDPETAARLLPNAGSPKNPVLINTGDTAVIGFIVLDSPLLHEAVSAAEDGSRVNETNREVWQYLTAGTEGFGEGWVPVETGYADSAHQTVPDADSASYVRRVFGWKDSLPGRNGETCAETAPLFEKIRIFNYVEGSLKPEHRNGIDVYFLAVQADNLPLGDGRVTTEASAKNMSVSDLQRIWEILGTNADFSDMPKADTSHRRNLAGEVREEKGGSEE